ncbi:MAG: hypothetical protein IPG50_25205 [Myxococcales bacterium]|nr:hypothetical protein [Myxococcales bacterium]
MEEQVPTCQGCGAPQDGNRVLCVYCGGGYSEELLRTAIPCPAPLCRVPNRFGLHHCARCQAWLVVACVFCGATSPWNTPACLQCGEGFQGAPERKAAREAAAQRQENRETASVVGDVAATFLGAVVGVMLDD